MHSVAAKTSSSVFAVPQSVDFSRKAISPSARGVKSCFPAMRNIGFIGEGHGVRQETKVGLEHAEHALDRI